MSPQIVRWLPADAKSGEPALFRCVHDDGDEEDLEEEEAEDAVHAFEAMGLARSRSARTRLPPQPYWQVTHPNNN